MSKLVEMRARYDEVCARIQETLDNAANRTLSADDGEKLEKMFADQDEIRQWIENEGLRERAEQRLANPVPSPETAAPIAERDLETEGREMFRDLVRGKRENIELRAPTPTTSTSADDQVPLALYQRYITMVDRLTAVRQACTVDQFATSDIRYSRQTAQVTISAATDDDGVSDFTDFNISTGDVVPRIQMFTAFSEATFSAVADSAFSLEDIILNQHAEAIGTALESKYIQGLVSGQGGSVDEIEGLFTDQGHDVSKADQTWSVKDLIAAYLKLAGTGYYNMPGSFVISGAMAEEILGSTDANDRLLLQVAAQASAADSVPFRVFGHPVYVTSGAGQTSSGSVQGCFCTKDAYHVQDVGTIRFTRDPFTAASRGAIRLISSMRSSGWFVRPEGHVAIKDT